MLTPCTCGKAEKEKKKRALVYGKKMKEKLEGGLLVLPFFSVCAEINQSSGQCRHSARDGETEFLAPGGESLLVLLTVK